MSLFFRALIEKAPRISQSLLPSLNVQNPLLKGPAAVSGPAYYGCQFSCSLVYQWSYNDPHDSAISMMPNEIYFFPLLVFL